MIKLLFMVVFIISPSTLPAFPDWFNGEVKRCAAMNGVTKNWQETIYTHTKDKQGDNYVFSAHFVACRDIPKNQPTKVPTNANDLDFGGGDFNLFQPTAGAGGQVPGVRKSAGLPADG